MSNRPPRILYLDSHDHATCLEKFAGARRFADAVGWSIVRKKITDSPTRFSALLTRLKPDGCLVNATRLLNALPPAAFGSTPVVYLDTDTRLFGRTCCVVAHDSDATGGRRAAEAQPRPLRLPALPPGDLLVGPPRARILRAPVRGGRDR